MAAKKIGIIGNGNVGTALERGLKRAGCTVLATHMDNGKLGDERLTAFAAGDDANAKADVLALERAIGFDAVDAGPLRNARLLEPLGYRNIQLGYGLRMGTDTGFKLMHGHAA